MTAIILAAGCGRRLGPLTAHLPKCLLQVGGQPILTHMLTRIQRAGVRDVVIVTGFEAERVRRHVASLSLSRLRVRLLHNERFADTNNLYSLKLALLQTTGPVTILNGDDLFNVNILRAVLRNPSPAAAAVDFTRPLPSDAMKIMVEGRVITALGKDLPAAAAVGNAIGLYRFHRKAADLLRAEVERWVADGRLQAFYVAAINALAPRLGLAAVSTAGLTWCEVDDVQDLTLAHAKVARMLTEETGDAALAVRRRLHRAAVAPLDVRGQRSDAPRASGGGPEAVQ